MINSTAFDYVNVLTKAADASYQREAILANNISNVDTPGYKRKDLNFEGVLSQELGRCKHQSLDKKMVAKAPDSLTTLGLGSCIGLTLYDPASKIGGLVHYMLPDSTKLRNNTNIAKFGDTGIRELYNQMIKNGANPRRMVAKIAGGAKMFEMSGNSTIGNVGDRNTDMARHVLAELKIPLKAQDTGLNYGRTVILDCETGDYIIKAVGKEQKVI